MPGVSTPPSPNASRSRCRRAWRAAAVLSTLVATAGRAGAEPSSLAPEVGYNYGEIETPRIAAMAGALRAWGSSLEGLFVNPANMSLTRVYHLGAFAQIWPEASRQSYGGGAVDSIVSSTRLAGGLGGTWNRQDPDGVDRTATDLRFALGLPVGERLHFGLGGRYLLLSQDGSPERAAGIGLDPSAASGGLRDSRIVKSVTFDAGATLKASDSFAIGLVGQNLSDPGHAFQPTTFGGGLGFGTPDFTLEADLVADFTTWGSTTARAMAGAEYLAGNQFPLRLGYRYDDGALSHAVSGGIGYLDREFSVDLAIRRVVSGDVATAVVFGFKYHLESAGVGSSSAEF